MPRNLAEWKEALAFPLALALMALPVVALAILST